MGAWVRRQASLSLLQHALHRTAAAPLPGQHLTGSGGVTVTIDSDSFPTLARVIFDNGNGVFGDAKNKFVIINLTDINVRLERLSQMLMYGPYELNWANENESYKVLTRCTVINCIRRIIILVQESTRTLAAATGVLETETRPHQ